MTLVLTIVLMITSALLIVMVLLHKGRGGGLSDMFGGGVSSSLGGSSVAERNLDRLTVGLGVVWFACVVALGKSHAGAFSTDEKLTRRIVALAEDAGESFWPMPVCDDHVRLIRSDIADLRNASGRAAGASTAAAFLSRFAGDTPWVHLDIAGTADTDREHDLGPKGATGCAVRTLVEIAERY